jgi:hypothetical protein
MQNSALLGLIAPIPIALIAACACLHGGTDDDHDSVGRCGVSIPALAQDERAAVARAFAERRGSGWQVSEVDAFAGHVVRARREISTIVEVVELDRTQAVAMALEALRADVDFLGLSETDLAALEIVGATYNPYAGPLQWMIEFFGRAPIPGYEDLDNERRLRVVVDIAKDGMLMGLFNNSDILPAFDICTTPMLAADDPRLRDQVLGTKLYYSDFTGNAQYAGTVEDENIVATERMIYVDRSQESRLVIRLAYRIRVAFDLLIWSFFVDADTGALILIKQEFFT